MLSTMRTILDSDLIQVDKEMKQQIVLKKIVIN